MKVNDSIMRESASDGWIVIWSSQFPRARDSPYQINGLFWQGALSAERLNKN